MLYHPERLSLVALDVVRSKQDMCANILADPDGEAIAAKRWASSRPQADTDVGPSSPAVLFNGRSLQLPAISPRRRHSWSYWPRGHGSPFVMRSTSFIRAKSSEMVDAPSGVAVSSNSGVSLDVRVCTPRNAPDDLQSGHVNHAPSPVRLPSDQTLVRRHSASPISRILSNLKVR